MRVEYGCSLLVEQVGEVCLEAQSPRLMRGADRIGFSERGVGLDEPGGAADIGFTVDPGSVCTLGDIDPVAAQFAIGVGHLTEPVAVHRLGQTELDCVVVACSLGLEFAGGAGWSCAACVSPEPGVGDDESLTVWSDVAYVLDGVIETNAVI